jgi:hypothetical protein
VPVDRPRETMNMAANVDKHKEVERPMADTGAANARQAQHRHVAAGQLVYRRALSKKLVCVRPSNCPSTPAASLCALGLVLYGRT